ncbi:porin [Stappia indica]|uniref:Porin n=1 Tax=Stappia indica TaxID=538381 RepID=A0A857CBE4_9HYPH|nr:porin [Stappia indica]QGZ36151.1 porin [Stappia indica]
MNIKSILLGASAAALAATGAQAADLPVAPEPVDYVRVCDAFGTGFFYIPGTETCLKIGGSVRAEFRVNDLLDKGGSRWGGATRNTLPLADSTTMRARGYFNFDSRTNTEYGLLRTYVSVWITADNSAPVATELDEAFIQLGGFVAGRTSSYFDFYTGNNWGAVLSQGFSDYGETNLFAYTAQFGNGFSASISAEAGDKKRAEIWDATLPAGVLSADFYSGNKVPDFVANLRVDQGWGSAQIMGALHHVYGRSVAGLTGGESAAGWAIGAGATFNLPMIAPGDNFSIQASYAQGAIGYVNSNWAGSSRFAGAAYNAAGQLKLSTAWGIGAGFTHFWTPAISTSITGSYSALDQATARFADIREVNVQGNLVWRPVSGLQVGAELEYQHRDRDFLANTSDLVGVFRVQRTF